MTYATKQPVDWLRQIQHLFKDCADLTIQLAANQQITLCYFEHLIDASQYHHVVTSFFDDAPVLDGLERMAGIFDEVHGHTDADQLHQFSNAVLSGKIGAIHNEAL